MERSVLICQVWIMIGFIVRIPQTIWKLKIMLPERIIDNPYNTRSYTSLEDGILKLDTLWSRVCNSTQEILWSLRLSLQMDKVIKIKLNTPQLNKHRLWILLREHILSTSIANSIHQESCSTSKKYYWINKKKLLWKIW